MHPILVKIGPVTIHTYGFMLAIGVLCAIGLSTRLAKKEKLETKIIFDFIFYTLLIGLVGAKLFLLVTDFGFYTRSFSNFKSLLFSGGTFFGGLIFGVLFAAWFLRKHKMNFKVVADIIAPAVALAHFFGRMGCFFAGCCWGSPGLPHCSCIYQSPYHHRCPSSSASLSYTINGGGIEPFKFPGSLHLL